MPFGIGPLELVIILVIVLLIAGPKRLPQMGRSLGSSMREFKNGVTGGNKHDEPDAVEPANPAGDLIPPKTEDAESKV